MFDVTLLDHLRLTFGHVVYRHRAHTHIASTRARWSRWLRTAEALLIAGVAFTAIAAAFGKGRGYEVASAVLAGLALAALLVHVTFDLDGTAQAHASCASRLWQIREQYRAVLSDLTDGAIDLDTGRRKRDDLMLRLHGIYENAPPAEYQAYQAAEKATLAAGDTALADEEIDRFLPKSLQKAEKPASADALASQT
jgi:uncharacterized membrane protein YidH (DUF202 family)